MKKMENVESFESLEDNNDAGQETDSEIGIQTDSVFESIPDNKEILNYSYELLANRAHKNWHFTKLVLILKNIRHELDFIETRRYFPGIRANAIMYLERNLGKYFQDLAEIFHEHQFIEKELWLTAFYLDPNPKNYEFVLRCGMRVNRRRLNDENEKPDRLDKKESNDYENLKKSLRLVKLPNRIVNDILTATFLPRGGNFSWSLNWHELRKRCKYLFKFPDTKRRLIELNMAEGNKSLKYLKIDYHKYQHRPQLNYGSIEKGYEGAINFEDFVESDDDGNESSGDDEENYDDYKMNKRNEKKRKSEEVKFKELTELIHSSNSGKRITRARAAEIIATTSVDKDEDISNETFPQASSENEVSNSSDEKRQREVVPECSNAQQINSTFNNETVGFTPFPDIWCPLNQVHTLEKIPGTALQEMKSFLDKFRRFKNLKYGCDNLDLIDYGCKEIEVTISDSENIQGPKNIEYSETKPSNVVQPTQVNKGNVADKAIENTELQSESEKTRILYDTKTEEPALISNESLKESPSRDQKSGTDDENRLPIIDDDSKKFFNYDVLRKECLEKEVRVVVKRLSISDLSKLRQPKVRLKRLNVQRYLEQLSSRRSRAQRRDLFSAYVNLDESSGSSSNSTHFLPKPKKETLFKSSSSPLCKRPLSDISSSGSDEYESCRKNLRRSYSGTISRSGSNKNLFVASCSDGGLKLRISSLINDATIDEPATTSRDVDDDSHFINYMNVSSTCSEIDDFNMDQNHSLMSNDNRTDPLYEEEVILLQ